MTKRYLLLLILTFAFVLRVWHLDSIPPGVNRDEAAIGYTAYSLLHTGRDEYGQLWPISLESFGDWKLPLYVYTDMLPLLFVPLSEWSVRIPSVLVGTLSVFLVYVLTKQLFSDWGKREAEKIGLMAAFFLAISPWHVHFSRVASEANLAMFLVLLGLVLFFRREKGPWYTVGAAVALGASLFTYHGNHVFTPLLILILGTMLLRSAKARQMLRLFFIPFLFLAGIIFYLTLFGADKTKISGLLPFSDQYRTYAQIVLPRLDHPDPGSLVAKLEHNKGVFFFEQVVQGYIKGFSPEFLFIQGGNNQQHNIPNFGNFYVIEGVFMLVGLFILFALRHPWRWFLLGWLLIAPIPAALTKDAPHSARMLAVLPLPHILSAVGLWYLVRNRQTLVAAGSALIIAVSFLFFADRYFIHMPRLNEAVWGGGYPELVAAVDELKPRYQTILMDRPDYSPYIYFLFYRQYDPVRYQQEVVRYPVDREGFHHVQQFDSIRFQKLDWGKDLLTPNRLLISWADNTPAAATAGGLLVDQESYAGLLRRFGTAFGLRVGDTVENRVIKTIYLKNGQPQFYLIDVRKIQ